MKKEIEEKYGKQLAKNRIFVTTDSQKGVLLNLALKEGYQIFVIPDSV
ncbi:glucose-6-phosphate isomerase, partial ['Chrysanthemum coronarium' phytoplasma]